METAVLVYSHAPAAGPVRRDVPLPPDFARVAVYEKEAVHAGYGKRANHIIGSKAHHHSEWQQRREDAGFRRRMAERADGLFSGQTGTVIRGMGHRQTAHPLPPRARLDLLQRIQARAQAGLVSRGGILMQHTFLDSLV
jgi:hypothetical protein